MEYICKRLQILLTRHQKYLHSTELDRLTRALDARGKEQLVRLLTKNEP